MDIQVIFTPDVAWFLPHVRKLCFFSTCFYIYRGKYVLMLALQSTSVNYLRRYFRLYIRLFYSKELFCSLEYCSHNQDFTVPVRMHLSPLN